MSDVNSIMGSNEAYYDPSKDVPSIVPEGMFKAYATKLSEREVIVRDKYVADVFDIEFELAEENKGESVEIDGKAVDKGGYAGKTVRSKGFFRFKKPDPSNSLHDGLEMNTASNKSYMELLNSFSIETEEDEEGRYFLPHINESDVSGKAVILEIVHEHWTSREGDAMVTPKAKAIFVWEGQAPKKEELPF